MPKDVFGTDQLKVFLLPMLLVPFVFQILASAPQLNPTIDVEFQVRLDEVCRPDLEKIYLN